MPLSIPRGATEVDLKHCVSPVGQQLGLGVESPDVVEPWAAVHAQNQRQSRRVNTDGQREERVQWKTVARRDADADHRSQLRWIELGVRAKEQSALASRVVVEVGQIWLAIVLERGHPALPGLVGGGAGQDAVGKAGQRGVNLGELW